MEKEYMHKQIITNEERRKIGELDTARHVFLDPLKVCIYYIN